MPAGEAPPHPPRLRFNLAVTGHRLSHPALASNGEETRATLDRIFGWIARAVGEGTRLPTRIAPPRLHCLLSDGLDQWAATMGLARGWELVCPLPFGAALHHAIVAEPETRADAQALRAILQAELIVLGPGSLYTSVLPNLLVDEVAEAIRVSPALKVYVCNVAVQPGETNGYSVEDHVRAIENHVGPGLIDVVVANNNLRLPGHVRSHVELVQPTYSLDDRIPIVYGDLFDPASPWRHHPDRLARCLLDLHLKSRGADGRRRA